jgi:hypothetical protein
MKSAVFVKCYRDPARGLAAQAHLRWWEELDAGVRLPHQFPSTPTHSILERIPGSRAGPHDLDQLAAVLGRLHGTAYVLHLHWARLDQPFGLGNGLTIPDFYTGRYAALAQIPLNVSGFPAATYKDANIRNFVITPTEGPAVVDFDDLTLAPFGYDLAKLVVSTAMTHGRIPPSRIITLLDIYNEAVTAAGGPANSCQRSPFTAYTGIHGLLTARYLHTNGYRYPWSVVRP